MEDQSCTLIHKRLPMCPQLLHRIQVSKIDAVGREEILGWQGFDYLRHLFRELAFPCKELHENKPSAR